MGIACSSSYFSAALGSSLSFDPDADAIMIGLWKRYNVQSTGATSCSFSASTANSHFISTGQGTAGTGRPRAGYRDTNTSTVNGDNLVNPGELAPNWVHIMTAMRAQNDKEIYFQGVSENTQTTTDALNAMSLVTVGGKPNGAELFDGDVAEVVVYASSGFGMTAAITDQIAAALFAGANPLTVYPELLRAYYPMYNLNFLNNMLDGAALVEQSASTATDAGSHPPVMGRFPPHIITVPEAVGGGGIIPYASYHYHHNTGRAL